jgi:Uma2 family endonuclease
MFGMPVAVEPPVSVIAPPHKLWTREECALLEQAGLADLDRYELIGGELVLKTPKNKLHLLVQALLHQWLVGFAGVLRALQEPTIDLRAGDEATSAPEPDVVLLSRTIREISGRPGPGDLLLVAEVSGATLAFDLTVKAGLYARAGIAEYWVVDLHGRRVILHRRPEAGAYLDVAAYAEDEFVATLGAPEASIRVADLF